MEKNVILLNNLFNGKYIEEKVGGEIINIYQCDNDNYYVYVNPYGNIGKEWDNKIKYILFIRSVGNGTVKIIAKAKIEEQINPNSSFSKKNAGEERQVNEDQKAYIDKHHIEYGETKLYQLGSWSEYFITFKTEPIYKAKENIYLSTKDQEIPKNTIILENTTRINNQSQKRYIEPSDTDYLKIEKIIEDKDLWEEEPVGKISIPDSKTKEENSFLSIIKKENSELVISNLLAYFLKKDKEFWSNFVEKVLKIDDDSIIKGSPEIIQESKGNIDLFIKVGKNIIVIENKIKSGINGKKKNGYSQLEKYVAFIEKNYPEPEFNHSFYLLRPNYNNEPYEDYNKENLYKEIKYLEIYEIIKDRSLELYFEEFKRVVEKHSSEYDNELFEIMNERFLNQIKNKKQ